MNDIKYENEGPLRDAFIEGLLAAGFDSHGYRYGPWAKSIDTPETKTENFEVIPYDEKQRPNFSDNSRGIWLRWYKWPLRDATSNKALTTSDVRHMMSDLARETRKLGAQPVVETDVDLSPLDEELEVVDMLCANPSVEKIPKRLKAAYERILKRTEKLRFPSTPSELAWAIRLDDISKPDKLVISAKLAPGQYRKQAITTYVTTKDDQIEVDRSISDHGMEVAHAMMFSGGIEKFNESLWSTLTMNRLGKDCPNLEGLRAVGETFITEPTRRGMRNVSMLDIKHDELDQTEKSIRGIAKLDFVIDTANGFVTLTIDETDGSRSEATFDVDDIRKLCLLAKLREKDLFYVDVFKGCAAARVGLGHAELTSDMEDLWDELEEKPEEG